MNKPKHEVQQRDHATLALLSNYCVLSTSTIRCLLEPKPSTRQVERSIERLAKAGRAMTRKFRIGGGHANFHELTEDMRQRLKLKKVHTSHLDHNDYIAMSVEILKRWFPEARFVFEKSMSEDAEAHAALGAVENPLDALPDALMILPSSSAESRYIAIEVERFQKCTSKLLYKLGRYATRTQLDGVLYLAPERTVLKSVSRRYQQLLQSKGARIRHYHDYFLANALLPTKHQLELTQAHNAIGEPVSIRGWIQTLRDLDTQNRKPSSFSIRGGVHQ